MKTKIFLLLIITCFIRLVGRCQDKELIKMLDGHNCDVTYRLIKSNEWQGDSVIGARLVLIPDLNATVLDFINHNSEDLKPELLKMLRSTDYDWVACIIIYYITQEDAKHLSKYDGDCVKWRRKGKNKEILYWEQKW